jgi:hypothetical protein
MSALLDRLDDIQAVGCLPADYREMEAACKDFFGYTSNANYEWAEAVIRCTFCCYDIWKLLAPAAGWQEIPQWDQPSYYRCSQSCVAGIPKPQ